MSFLDPAWYPRYQPDIKEVASLFSDYSMFAILPIKVLASAYFESCLYKSHTVLGRADFQNIRASPLLKCWLTVSLVNMKGIWP